MRKIQDKIRVTAGLSATLVVFTMGGQTATAQSTGASETLEEIIITAERREANLQKTAASVSVVTGEQLAEQGKYSLGDILQDIPGVSGGAFAGVSGNIGSDNVASGIVMRGVGSNQGGGGETVSTSSTAAIYVDGVYEGTGGNYDIERVEVLRGPQGTLYGRSATSGLVAIHTRNPDLGNFGGDVTAEFGNYNLRHYNAAVNLPVVNDQLAIRVSGNHYERDGLRGALNQEGEPTGGPGGASKTDEGRIKLLYRPIEDLSILLGVALQNNKNQSGGAAIANSTSRDVVIWETAPQAEAKNNYRQYWAQIDWNLGFGTLTYQPAYRTWNQNGHSISQTVFLIDTFVDTPEDRFWTHELRLASNPDSTVNWQTGVTSYDNRLKNLNEWHFIGAPSPGGLFSSRDTDKSTKQIGLFAEATYPIADDWRVTAGLRYDSTKVEIAQQYIAGFPFPGQDAIPKAGEDGKRNFNNWTYKLRGEHDLSSENLVYASISTGFSPGDVSLATNGTTIGVIDLKSETLTAYEIGSKNRFLDNRLQLNGAAFYNDYGAYQTGSLNISSNPAQLAFASLAVPVQAWGVELELLYQITSDDRVGFNFAYTDARYIDKASVPVFAAANANDMVIAGGGQGATAPSPFTANLTYDHLFHLPGGWTWNVHGDVKYLSAHDGSLTGEQQRNGGESIVRIGDEAIANFNTTAASEGGRYSITAWVRNVADNQYIKAVALNTTGAPGDPFQVTQTLYDPRTFGVSASVKF